MPEKYTSDEEKARILARRQEQMPIKVIYKQRGRGKAIVMRLLVAARELPNNTVPKHKFGGGRRRKTSRLTDTRLLRSHVEAHNKRLLKSHNGKSEFKPCNCKYKRPCPLNGNCRDKAIVYQATVQTKDQSKNYIGLCETEFKAKFYNHNHSFNSDSKRNATELSKFIWSCKDSGLNPVISWKIVCHATPYQHGGKVCNLCLAEKYAILTANDDALLNKRTELVNKCRHKNKYKLINAKLKL